MGSTGGSLFCGKRPPGWAHQEKFSEQGGSREKAPKKRERKREIRYEYGEKPASRVPKKPPETSRRVI